MNPVCPYCGKNDFIPFQPIQEAEMYGRWFNFNCSHCDQVVKALFGKMVTVDNIQKTEEKSYWNELDGLN